MAVTNKVRYTGPGQRRLGIDVLRGLAVLLMVLANLSPALGSGRPSWYRFVASLAAPLFVTLAGLMVGAASDKSTHDLYYYLKRGGLLWALGAFIDLAAWGNAPLITFDVLYLIGASLPLAYLLCRLPAVAAAGCAIAAFAIGPLAVSLLGYPEELPAASLQGMHALGQGEAWQMAMAWLFQGWFPLFPWLGFCLLGAWVGRLWTHRPRGAAKLLVLAGAVAAFVGGLWWASDPGPQFEREGYAELFYPPSAGFLLCTAGLCLVGVAAALRLRMTIWLEPLRLLGEASLLAYLVHCLLLGRVVHPLLEEISLPHLAALTVAITTLLVIVNAGARWLRGKWTSRPLVARLLLGG